MKDFYIGSKKIKGINPTELKTPAGDMIHEVLFKDDTKVLMADKKLKICRTEKPLDANASSENFIGTVAAIVFGVLHEYDLTINELNPFSMKLLDLVNNSTDKTADVLWGAEAHERTLNQMNGILTKNLKENEEK